VTARLDLEYDGGGFSGWARQPDLRTVQGDLEGALERVLGRSVSVTVAGRTDAGVHARGQVASHEGDPAPAVALNGVLAPDVRVLASRDAPGFDARADALSRVYRYRLFTRPAGGVFERGRSLHWPRPLDLEAMRECAEAVIGAHDFTAFTRTETHHVRFSRDILRSEWREPEEHVLEYWIEADSFMRHMVRTLVGTMLDVGSARMAVTQFIRLLDGARRHEAGDTAPAHGLYLEAVRY
jgi:tRNA pseudouridine38-40 synthase